MSRYGSTRGIGFACSIVGALALVSVASSQLLAQGHVHAGAKAARQYDQNALVQVVRDATERFKDVAVAEAEGYHLLFGCVSGPDSGAMGLHYVNLEKVLDGVVDPTDPEIILYEPLPNGRLRMTGADFLVFADAWDETHTSAPELMGQFFHYFESPNRFGLPRFYTLHVWAWKESPTGTFVNWHSNVSCDAFGGQ